MIAPNDDRAVVFLQLSGGAILYKWMRGVFFTGKFHPYIYSYPLPTEIIYILCVVPAEVSCRRASTTAKTIPVGNTPKVLSRCTLTRPIESMRHREPYDYQKGGSQFPSIRPVRLLQLAVSHGRI